MNRDDIRIKAGNFASEIVHQGVGAILQNGGNIAEATHMALNTALCALVPIVPALSNRPQKTAEEFKAMGNKELEAVVNSDTILFAALVLAHMHKGFHGTSQIQEDDKGVSIGCEQMVEFGPEIMGEALNDWKKVTGKDPAKYIEPKILEAIANVERDSTAPFDEFLAKRINSVSSKTVN